MATVRFKRVPRQGYRCSSSFSVSAFEWPRSSHSHDSVDWVTPTRWQINNLRFRTGPFVVTMGADPYRDLGSLGCACDLEALYSTRPCNSRMPSATSSWVCLTKMLSGSWRTVFANMFSTLAAVPESARAQFNPYILILMRQRCPATIGICRRASV